jgi:uncharacterized protein YfbU (UPF0304 family)
MAVEMSDGERLIAMMLAELMQHLDVQGELDPELIKTVLIDKDYWILPRKYPGLFNDEAGTPEAVVAEVVDLLEMMTILERSIEALPEPERAAAQARPFHRWEGFDGNEEGRHLGVARTLIEEFGHFPKLGGRDMNSHWPTLDRYRRMHVIFQSSLARLRNGKLSFAQIQAILDA